MGNILVLSVLFLFNYSRISDSVSNYAFYLGSKGIEELKSFDMAVISPKLSPKYIRKLHKNGTKVVASVKLLDSVEVYRVLTEQGFDGFFFELSGVSDAVKKVQTVRDSFPNALILVHPEITQLESVARYVDGVIWTGLSTSCNSNMCGLVKDDSARKYIDYITVNLVKRLERIYRFKVFSLDMLSDPTMEDINFCYNRAMKFGFIPYVSTPELDVIVWPPHKRLISRSVAQWNSLFDPNFKLPSQIRPEKNPNNLALSFNGGKVLVDSNSDGADPKILNDGFRNDQGIAWMVRTWWASSSSENEHFVVVKLPKEVYLDSVKIYWPVVNGVPMSPVWYRLEARSSERNFWWPIITANGRALRKMDKFFFSDALASEIRVVIKPGTGPELTPNQLWLSEIEVYGRP